jgi:ferredoxin/flavodoxin---NADP+ reductase
MSRIVKKIELVKDIYEFVIESPLVAAKAQPGHFVIVMADEFGERIPLTVADYDRDKGTITLILMAIGTSTRKLAGLGEGDSFHAFIGPLGHPSELDKFRTVIMVAGGVGTAPIFPIARSLKEMGNKVISIQGARTKDLLFWEEKLAGVSDEHIVCTDDGSHGRKGLVTEPLKDLLEADTSDKIGCVYAIGPAVMMKFCAKTTEPFKVKTIVSLNTVMVDGTGMCGGCRVNVGGKNLFTCVDGPEFDGHLVDWDTLLSRQKIYVEEEQCSLDRYMEEVKKHDY